MTALRDDQPSPWVPCPQCGEIWHRIIATIERGEWRDTADLTDQVYAIDHDTTPNVTAFQVGEQAIECTGCGHRFGLTEARR